MKNFLIALILMAIAAGFSQCTQSGRRKPNITAVKIASDSQNVATEPIILTPDFGESKTTVKMQKKGGVYEIPIEINQVKMYFIFDTGAGLVSISETEAMFLLKQGSLTEDDILGTGNFVDATGNVSEGTIINLKTVKLGDRTLYNVRASVVHNLEAPLLLGQSVLEQFGKVSIDYMNGEIILE